MKKKNILFFLIILILCIILFFFLYHKDQKNNTSKLTIPIPVQWETPAGIKVLYFEDNEIPIVRANLYMESFLDDTDNPLSLFAMGDLLKRGGSINYPPNVLNLELEKLSASISSSWSNEYGQISFSSLNEDFEEVFKIVSDIVLNPLFDKQEFELWKMQKIDSIKRRSDSANALATSKFKSLLYKNSNFGYISTTEDVDKLTRSNLFNSYKNFVIPNNSYLTIAGQISRKKIEKLIEKYLSSWKKIKKEKKDKDYSFTPESKQIYFIEKEDATQATVYVIAKGPERKEENYLKYITYSDYLGTGGFSSILFKKLRNENGLVYSTYGGVLPSFPYGSLTLFFETKNENTVKALGLIEDISNDLTNIKVVIKDKIQNEKESKSLEEIKQSLINTQIFKNSSLDSMLQRKVYLTMWNFSKNYDLNFENNIKSFNFNDIQSISRQYFDLNNAFVVIVSSPKALDDIKTMIKDQKTETLFSNFSLNICSIKNEKCEIFEK